MSSRVHRRPIVLLVEPVDSRALLIVRGARTLAPEVLVSRATNANDAIDTMRTGLVGGVVTAWTYPSIAGGPVRDGVAAAILSAARAAGVPALVISDGPRAWGLSEPWVSLDADREWMGALQSLLQRAGVLERPCEACGGRGWVTAALFTSASREPCRCQTGRVS